MAPNAISRLHRQPADVGTEHVIQVEGPGQQLCLIPRTMRPDASSRPGEAALRVYQGSRYMTNGAMALTQRTARLNLNTAKALGPTISPHSCSG